MHDNRYNIIYNAIRMVRLIMSQYFPGQLRRNLRRRSGRRDPKLLGWARIEGVMVSLAAWAQESPEGMVALALTVQNWSGAGASAGSGRLESNPRRSTERAPHLLGRLCWQGTSYSVGAWVHQDTTTNQEFLKLTLKPDEPSPSLRTLR